MSAFKFLNTATLQEIFNKGYLGLAKQGFEKSVDTSAGCLYRGPNGLQCFVGHCMSNEEIQAYEGPEVDSVESSILRRLVPDELFPALQAFRVDHDNSDDPADMEYRLVATAKSYGLTIPPIPRAVS